MLSKNEVKDIQSLCHKKSRDEQGVFIAEGPKMLLELLEAGFEIVQAFALKGWIEKNKHYANLVTEINEIELAKISNLKTPNEAFVIAKKKAQQPEPITNGSLVLVLDELQDPGNLGTIIRIADWFGIKQIVASTNSVEQYNPKVVQATMGSVCRVDVWYKNLEDWLPTLQVDVYGALLNGESVYKVEPVKEGVLVIGNESRGIGKELLPMISHPVTIPKIGEAESLNAAVATGIILSHLRK